MTKRNYIDSRFSVSEFFSLLNQRGVEYVVLRWFNDVTCKRNENDIDILIADEYIYLVADLIVSSDFTVGRRVDIYSSGGLYKYSYLKIPYYPRHLASQILESRVFYNELFYTPSSFLHLLSFAFHVVFHKSDKSGLPITVVDNGELDKSNKYILEIKRLCLVNEKIIDEISLSRLYDYLSENNWIPSIEWIRKIAFGRSDWLMGLCRSLDTDESLTVFVLREVTSDFAFHKKILEFIKLEGGVLLHYSLLDEIQRKKATLFLRGGKWDSAPRVFAGGYPHSIYVVFDQSIEVPDASTKLEYPYLANKRSLTIKRKVREYARKKLNYEIKVNCIHCSDDDLEAMEYIKILFPDLVSKILELSKQLKIKFTSPYNVFKRIENRGRRAKIELIDFGGALAICKTFKEGQSRYFKRELAAYKRLSPKYDFVPKLLAYHNNTLIIEYIKSDSELQLSLLKSKVRDVVRVFFCLWNEGVAHLDFHPGNFIIDNDGRLYLVDFEFFYSYKSQPDSWLKSYDIVGIRNHEAWGINGKKPVSFINNSWLELTGFSLKQIVDTYKDENYSDAT